jgi:asparagine synthase (glutamine-hydrolysing)
MCGIGGIWDLSLPAQGLHRVATAIGAALAHRGPDDAGIWVDGECNIAFAHRRLAIVDLSSAVHQPMVSAAGRYVITYNGEVYNHRELRRELEGCGHRFRGHCDTEVVLAAFEQWGIERAATRFLGMFAMGVWDRRAHTLHLVRDRLGIKPLYFGRAGEALVFASELSAFRAHPDFAVEADDAAVRSYLCYGYVPAPLSIYRGVYKLAAGCILSLTREELEHSDRMSAFPHDTDRPVSPQRFWSAQEAAERGAANARESSEQDVCDQLEALLRDAIRIRRIADVPVGMFFSGGIDSSLLLALMQSEGADAVRTFTISFDDDAFNEGGYAAAVARHLQAEHSDLRVRAADAIGMVPRIVDISDEPTADRAMIPGLMVSEFARRDVKVCISGEGGDELFGGYHRYYYLRRLENLPSIARRFAASALNAVPMRAWHPLLRTAGAALPGRTRVRLTADKPYRLAAMMRPRTSRELLVGQISHWNGRPVRSNPAEIGGDGILYPSAWADLAGLSLQSMYLDSTSYLPDCLLAKLDRTTMAAGLEGRVPLLDHRVFEFGWELPPHLRLDATARKRVLRRILEKYVPRALVDRPKHGFAVPVGSWIRGPLREWAENLLNPRVLAASEYYDQAAIRTMWSSHLRGHGDWTFYLWPVLALQAWKEKWL